MTERKPGRNTLAIILQALLVLYVGSYLGIRSISARMGPGHYVIAFGVSPSEYMAAGRAGSLVSPSRSHKARFLRTLYSPLRWTERLITGGII